MCHTVSRSLKVSKVSTFKRVIVSIIIINYFIDTKVHAEITFDGDKDLFLSQIWVVIMVH